MPPLIIPKRGRPDLDLHTQGKNDHDADDTRSAIARSVTDTRDGQDITESIGGAADAQWSLRRSLVAWAKQQYINDNRHYTYTSRDP